MSREKRPLLDRLMEKVCPEPNSGCWLWTASVDAYGYGQLSVGHARPRKAHKLLYEKLVGPVPVGLELDHKCRTKSCVNPAHLEPVTHKENCRRSPLNQANWALRIACKRGHPFSGDNLYVAPNGERVCRACARRRLQQHRERERNAIAE